MYSPIPFVSHFLQELVIEGSDVPRAVEGSGVDSKTLSAVSKILFMTCMIDLGKSEQR
jgi:hypothetical protein